MSTSASPAPSYSYSQSCRERNTAKNLMNLSVEQRKKVETIYEQKGFPKNFRPTIDNAIGDSLDWAGYDSKTLQCRLAQFVKKCLPDFYDQFRAREGAYTTAFKECYDKELAEYASKIKKPASNKQSRKRPSGQQAAPNLGQVRFAYLSEQPNSELVKRLSIHISMLLPCKQTVDIHSSVKDPDSVHEFRTALENASMIGQQIVDLFRYCINECREKQARYALSVDEQGESEEIRHLDQDINHIEVHAQTFVQLMYDFIICAKSTYPTLANKFIAFIRDVTQITFLVSRVSQQQTIKDNVNFNASVRLLTLPALRSLSSADFSQTVFVSYAVVHEDDVEKLIKDPNAVPTEAAKFASDSRSKSSKNSKVLSLEWKHMRYPKREDNRAHYEQVTVEFTNLKIEKTKSSDEEPKPKQKKKKSSQPKKMPAETEKKTVLLFTAYIKFTDGAQLAIRTHSNVQVLITHVKQKCPAWRTLIWHNAFYSPNKPIPLEVDWDSFIVPLNRWFAARTDAPLQPVHVEFIRQCISGPDNKVKYSSLWDEPDKESRSPIRLQFWPFFFKCTMAISEVDQLRTLWKKNLLYGFVSNDDACSLIGMCPNNALIRFSNTKKRGAIVVMMSRELPDLSEVRVCSLAPFTLKKNSNELFESLFDIGVDNIYPNKDWKTIVEFTHESITLFDGPTTPYVQTVNKLVVPRVEEWPVSFPERNGTPSSCSDDITGTDEFLTNNDGRSEIESSMGDIMLDDKDDGFPPVGTSASEFMLPFNSLFWNDGQHVNVNG